MQPTFSAARAALRDAQDLVDRFGENAADQAAERAERSRDRDNILLFCHWREIERMIGALNDLADAGTVH